MQIERNAKEKHFFLFNVEREYLRPKVKDSANRVPSFVNSFQFTLPYQTLRISKPMLLLAKTSPFALQNMTFRSPKPKLFQSKTSRFAIA